MLRNLIFIPLAVILLGTISLSKDNLDMSPIEKITLQYRFDLFGWEIKHISKEWSNKLLRIVLPNTKDRTVKVRDMEEYFHISEQIGLWERENEFRRLNQNMEGTSKNGPEIYGDHKKLKSEVENSVESEISSVLYDEGLISKLGFVFPPVDLTLSHPPKLLVVSPRDQISRHYDVLIDPNITTYEMEYLEGVIESRLGLSALVVNISGIATYPTIVRPNSSLLSAARLASHEWLHTYWFFYPLGQNYWRSSNMTVLNETAATIAGNELGNMVYEAITGNTVQLQQTNHQLDTTNVVFDYFVEMKKTRLKVEELLGLGAINQAENYMEEQRKIFLGNGYPIRKINQAFFAFHGTYATEPESINPIGVQLEMLRNSTDTVGDFVKTVRRFPDYATFLAHIENRL